MEEKDIEKKLRDAWEAQPAHQPEERKEALWDEFATQTFPARKKHFRKWLYPAAAVLVIALTVGSIMTFTNIYKEDSSVAYNRIENPTLDLKVVFLPDSSVVELEPGSGIRYRNDFKTNREVSLKGKAFFKVQKDKMHPFMVTCNHTVTTVLGTSFTVAGDKNKVQVNLYEGRVQMNVKDNNSNWILSPGEQFIYANDSVAVVAFNRFKDFDDAEIISVLKYIEASYGYKVEMPAEYLKKKITLRINKKESLLNVVSIIAQMCNLNPSINEELKKITFQ
ncbi:FecR domain-containing protein [Flavobacterium salilacus subsp. salilacus]|uniref:FecR family protein n=1 Tax=Flavobacterium TaxID=237 RepID=UPI001075639E|nr:MULTISPECIES: FecR family protein [Flavobacterium]KAF2515440.1 FecR domain-containing protein [Flavobacterium salilacus subsp. salilacus]MBE1615835.1 FecR domain-containing protein [Flavobacterium sp. SaA2.13]